jgi:acetyltransferase-like isoleucine patch superfamily enzyme
MSVLVLQALMHIKCHPAFAASPAIGGPGFAMPRIDEPRVIAVEEATLSQLSELGIRVEGAVGEGCVIILDAAMPTLELRCRFGGHADCAAIIGLGEGFSGTLTFTGPHGLFVSAGFGRMGDLSRIAVTIEACCAAYFGRSMTSVDSLWQVEGDETAPCAIVVGDDAMVARDVACSNYHGHALIDIDRLEVINNPGSVVLGPHCCLEEQARVLGTVQIGAGSIIGLGSVVTEDIPDRVAASGVPAVVLQEGVTWDRRRRPSAAEIRAMLATG